MRRPLLALFTLFATGPACGTTITLDDGDTSGNSTEGPGTTSDSGPPVVSTTSANPSTSGPPATGDASTDGGATFIDPSAGGCSSPIDDGGGATLARCSTLTQDCCAGEKCMPWANDGGAHWNATRCSPISDMPGQLGESCSVEGSNVSGIDTCDLGLMCWGVDPQTLTGECTAMCSGDASAPVCPADYSCSITNDGVLTLCLLDCDPIAMDCPAAQCVPSDDAFGCVPPVGDLLPGDACETFWECSDGAACIAPENVPDCAGAVGCCSNFCDLTAPDPALGCLPGQTCLPWYDPGDPPPEYEHVGVCGVEVPA
jgi:hypothetical protein